MRVALLLLVLPGAVVAQSSPLLTSSRDPAFSIEVLHPFFKDNYDRFLTSGGAIISGRLGRGSGVALLADLPLYHGRFEQFDGTETSAGVGNPYVGVQFAKPDGGARFELGARVPLMDDRPASGALWAARTDLDRAEAFGPDLFTLWGIAQFRSSATASAIQTSARFGFMHARYGGTIDQTANQMVYALTLTGRPELLVLDLGVSGRLSLEALDAGLSAATLHQLNASMRTRIGSIVAGTQLRVPLDDAFNHDFSLALSFEVR